LSTQSVTAQPVRTVLSGPAAGIAATVHLARRIGRPNLVTYDMGGTSTDVALVHNYEFPLKRETILDGLILKLPQLDIHTIGAGGGSIAALDAGGGLQLGPESAGSDPGPAAYGLGGRQPTVTDANVVLGRIGAGQELGKSLKVDRERAVEAMSEIASRAGLSAEEMADAVLKLGVAKMAAAVGEISTMRGFDPRDFTLLSYGGAGPLHAALVAAEAGISEVIVPPNPGAFSAFGTLCSALRKDRSETVLTVFGDSTLDHARHAAKEMAGLLLAEFAAEGSNSDEVIFEHQFDMRYRGQAHEMTVTVPEDAGPAEIAEIFEAAFEREYGRRDKNREIELVNVRLVASIPLEGPAWRKQPDGDGQPASRRLVTIDSSQIEIAVWSRDALTAQTVIHGPAIVDEMSSTTYLPPGWVLSVGEVGEMLLRQG
jgi:N-methylhydantoinase A